MDGGGRGFVTCEFGALVFGGCEEEREGLKMGGFALGDWYKKRERET